MSQRRLAFIFIAVFLIVFIGILMKSQKKVDMILYNGIVYTVDRDDRVAEAVAVRGRLIEAVGSTVEIKEKYKSDLAIDLRGKAVYPGFIDSHAHMVSLGTSLMTLNLDGAPSPGDVAAMVSEQIRKNGTGSWVRGRGWDQNLWNVRKFPTAAVLDRVAPNTPVYLLRVDGHAVWVNTRVLSLAGITRESRDPEGGVIVRDGRGEPTGILIDNAITLVESVIPPITDEEVTAAIRLAVQTFLRVGVTEVHDMGVTSQMVRAYKKLIDSGSFPFRVYAAIDGPGDLWEEYKKKGPDIDYGNGRLTVRALKMFVDGALGSRGAALLEPYADDPSSRGLTVVSSSGLAEAAGDALQHHFQLAVHAIGDRGNAILLDAYEKIFRAHPRESKDARFRDEHAQVLDKKDIPRFAELGVIPSMQPAQCTSDMRWAEARLGRERVQRAYAWRSLLSTGVIIAGGSDAPVESPDPLYGMYAAVTRQDSNGIPSSWRDVARGFELPPSGIGDTSEFANGWYARQCMTRSEALRSFTAWGAFAAFQEKTRGSIEPGKLADLTVLSNDIMKIPVRDILRASVEMTVVDGQIVYARLGSGLNPH